MFDDVVMVSFEFNGHSSRDEAAQALKKKKSDRKKKAITVQAWVIIQI